MGHDQRHGVGVLRADVGELDVEAVDRGDELRQGVQPGLGLAPVVALALVDAAAETCPYSKAVKGNIHVTYALA